MSNKSNDPKSLLALEAEMNKESQRNNQENKLIQKKKLIREIRDYIVKQIKVSNFLFTEDKKDIETLTKYAKEYLRNHDRIMTEAQIDEYTKLVILDIIGLGPLEQFRTDPTVKEIQCNNYKNIYVHKTTGETVFTGVAFDSEEDFMHTIDKIADFNNKQFGFGAPRLQGILPGRMRVHAIHNSICDIGCSMNIRKFPKRLTIKDLIESGSFSPEIAWFMSLIPMTRRTFAACGPTGSGKTTLGTALFDFAPRDLSIISIEDTRELDFIQKNWRPLVTREANSEGEGRVSIADLFKDCMRLSPDCIVVGEIRDSMDAYEMLQAFQTGHKGSFVTVHANSTMDFGIRMSGLINSSGKMNLYSAKELVSRAFDYIIFCEKDTINERTGKKKQFVKGIGEIAGFDYEKGEIIVNEIFKWKDYGADFLGNKNGKLEATGIMPVKLFAAAKEYGIQLDEKKFREVFLTPKAPNNPPKKVANNTPVSNGTNTTAK